MEDKNIISTSSQPAPVTIKNDPQVSQVEAKDANLGGSGTVISKVEVVTVKGKRGRPRKFDHVFTGARTISQPQVSPPPGFLSNLSSSIAWKKRGRGRPPGSGRLQLLASLGDFAAKTAGGSFIPHVVAVNSGEDVVNKILLLAQKGPRAVCILSATGIVSSVIIRQPGASGGILRYEGLFEILSLSGSFTFGEATAARHKTGMLSVLLAKPDGRVFGGGVVGSLIASGPIQLIVASFKQNIIKGIKYRHIAESSTAAGVEIGNSEMVSTDCVEDCTTPATSALLEPTNGETAANITTTEPISDIRISPPEIISRIPKI